jgi:hypothetical protein
MRILIVLAALMVFTSPALAAENPDGPAGTVWIDLGGNAILNGQWTLEGRNGTRFVEDKNRALFLNASIGFVVAPRATLAIGVSRNQYTAENVGGETYLDSKSDDYRAGVTLRLYVSLPERR